MAMEPQGLESDSLLGRAAANVLSLLASGRYVASRSSVKMIGMEINGMNLWELLGANNYVWRCLALVVVFEDDLFY